MKADRAALHEAVKAATRAARPRAYAEILQCALLSSDGETLTVRSTDMDLWIEAQIPCEAKMGPIAVKAAMLENALATMRGSTVEIKITETVTLKCSGSQRSLPKLAADQFPVPRETETISKIVLKGGDFQRVCASCLPCTTDEPAKIYSHGIRFEGEPSLKASALDGHSMTEIMLDGECDDLDALPHKSLFEAASKIVGDAPVEIVFSRSDATIKAGQYRIRGPLVDGKIPRAVLHDSDAHKVTAQPQEIIAAIRAVTQFGADDKLSASKRIVMELNGSCALSGQSHEGHSTEPFDGEHEGEAVRIGIASSRLERAVAPFGNKKIEMRIDGPEGMAVVTSPEAPGVLSAVSFMRI